MRNEIFYISEIVTYGHSVEEIDRGYSCYLFVPFNNNVDVKEAKYLYKLNPPQDSSSTSP